RADGNFSTAGNGINRVENEIGQSLAHFAFDADKLGHRRIEFGLHLDGDPAALGDVAPAWPGHVNDLAGQLIDLKSEERFARVTSAIELAQAGHDVSNVLAGGLDVLQISFAVRAQSRFSANQQIGKADHRGKGVVDVMSDAAG